ncbi:hypothetical protein [Candidatus Mycolicibacterium alkanivorans]|uniref:Lipoprotein n=1 Tax=Candidatus Mycolicibacterium alkanivorans TaxID=2954114 RepID=A0ABS9YS68_9MYCO|nr:hypothetical protein [Candidatus Mycolicibacterium alkanivorans]MCI4673669.1 hypothetical protein [Candidatus Mycolicibacterium alkanivorans]
MAIRRVGTAVLIAAVVVTGAGCATPIPGTPVAAPGQAGKPLPPADLASTTCRQYLAMDEATRGEVIKAIGEKGNTLIAMNPEIWVGVAGALCTFVDPSAPVRDILVGQGLR